MSSTSVKEESSFFTLQVGWLQIVLSLSLIYALHLLVKYIRAKFLERDLKRKILHKRAVTLSAKRRLRNSLAEDEDMMRNREFIIIKSVPDLLKDLRDRTYSAVQVLHAFQSKALEDDEQTNCVTEFIEDAEKWAEALDKSVITKGPLHGLPISLKDNIFVKNYDCTVGLVGFVDKPVDYDANLVKVLKDLGAVPFVKTNIPQTCMAYHCINPIFGKTTHPLNPLRTPGGSSGGEAALIACGGSPLGFGTDIGGSGRIPAHFCGICSLKPTFNRLSPKTTREVLEGIQGVYATITPIAREVEPLVVAFRALLTKKMFNLDPETIPLPFNEELFSSKKPLRIGFYVDDGFVTPTPGCQRAVIEAKFALEGAGHELIPFTVPEPWNAFRLAIKLLLADGGESIKKLWKNDLIEEQLLLNARIGTLPNACKKFLSAIMKGVSPRGAIVIGETGSSAYQLWQTIAARTRYVALFLSSWNDLQLDALLAPGFSLPAPPHEYPEKLLPNAFPTLLYNLLNFPAGVVPITTENEQDQVDLETYRTDDLAFRWAKQATRGAIHMPLGVQIVALPWQEELVLRIMSELESLVK